MAYKDPNDPRIKDRKREHYARNKEAHLDRSKQQRADKRTLVNAAKAVPCADCGVSYPYWVMQFDHVRGEKVTHVSHMLVWNASMDAIQAEMDKCEVVCANCHATRTHERKRRSVV